MKRNLLRLGVIVMLLCQWFAPLLASDNVENTIFEGIEKTDVFQKKLITIDAFRETNNIYEHLPNLCVRAFLKAIEPRWHNRDSTLVFFAASELLRRQLRDVLEPDASDKISNQKKFPFVLYPPYQDVNWKKLLIDNYLLINVRCDLYNARFIVVLDVTIKPRGSELIHRVLCFYNFYLSYKPSGQTHGMKNLDIQRFRQQVRDSVDHLVSDTGKLFQNSFDRFYWQIGYVEISEENVVEYTEEEFTQGSLFNYWQEEDN